MSEFKVGDKVVYISSEVEFFDDSEIHTVSLVTENGLYKVQGLYFSGKALRHATQEEIKAGWREGSKEFDLFWYGQSLGEAIKAHELLGEELIEGGAAFVGNNSHIVQMVNDLGDDFPIENHISPNCQSKDV